MSAVLNTSRLLLVTAVPLMRIDGNLMLDDQTCDGLSRWAENFDRISYTGIEVRASTKSGLTESTVNWRDVRDIPCADRIDFTAFPASYKVLSFAKHYSPVRGELRQKIKESRYLCFTIGALAGDWGAVASLEAVRLKRRYAVSFDRLEYEVIRNTLETMPLRRRLKARILIPWMARYHHYLTQKSAVGLFQGEDCFGALSGFVSPAFRVYDTHTQVSDRISPETLYSKSLRTRSGAPLKISYAGRAAEMKGPIEWIRAISLAIRSGVALSAIWMGDGPMLEPMRREAEILGISDCIEFRGFISDRNQLLSLMRDTDLFLFCHKTPESPRCLVEALVSGAPLIGFDSPYPRALLQAHGGGKLVAPGDIKGLAEAIVALSVDRSALADLFYKSARAGERFDEETVYRERSNILKACL